MIINSIKEKILSSFRDPCGFVFKIDNKIYRQINYSYKNDYDMLMQSGLYDELVNNGLLIPHSEIEHSSDAYKIIQPELVQFISYPYEWSFNQLKDAALLTLQIQKTAFKYGMSLKDSSAYNIQFKDGKPVFIDTLSFERREDDKPWVAYKQFCKHFLAPLALTALKDVRLNGLLRSYIDGIPLDLASRILSKSSYLNFTLLMHIHMHAKTQIAYSNKKIDVKRQKMSKFAVLGLVDNLQSGIKSLKWKIAKTEWGDYYNNTNYTDSAFINKKSIINSFLDKIDTNYVWDMGANNGEFSRLASSRNIPTIAFDVDPLAVDVNYQLCVKNKEKYILPLIIDLTNPSSALGWENAERLSLVERGPADTAFALALIHHLAISNNVPFERIACFFSKICKNLIVEFVPKEDSKVQILLATRKDIFDGYTKEGFVHSFKKYFEITESAKIEGSERILYLMKKR